MQISQGPRPLLPRSITTYGSLTWYRQKKAQTRAVLANYDGFLPQFQLFSKESVARFQCAVLANSNQKSKVHSMKFNPWPLWSKFANTLVSLCRCTKKQVWQVYWPILTNSYAQGAARLKF